MRVGIGWIAGVSRMVSALLFDVSVTDPLIYAESIALMMLVALLASAQPAIRAAREDPTHALRTN
jgi:ABC-type antimicrobial peptide transport system permease subunit